MRILAKMGVRLAASATLYYAVYRLYGGKPIKEVVKDKIAEKRAYKLKKKNIIHDVEYTVQ